MKAKDLIIDEWLNTNEDFSFDIKGNYVKVIHAFQILCPGCVYRGIPQAHELYNRFNSADVKVVGLHSVFEHHEAMKPIALKVFISEWGLPFPVAIDSKKEGEWMPETMKTYQLQGTPSLVIIDRKGIIRLNFFGHADEQKIEELIKSLIKEK